MRCLKTFIALLGICLPLSLLAATSPQQFISDKSKQAEANGISAATIKKYFTPITLNTDKSKVADPKQVRSKKFSTYQNDILREANVERGQRLMRNYRFLLRRIRYDYNVHPRFIIAVWGVRSNYGRNKGDAMLIRSLANIAYHYPENKGAQNELIAALKVLDRTYVLPAELKSSPRGEMGNPQMLPTTYLRYGVDYEREGLANIWTSSADSFASIANILHEKDWQDGVSWGMRVKLPENFPKSELGPENKRSIKHWQQLGVKQPDNQSLPNVKGSTAIVMTNTNGNAYLVLHNFFVLLDWKMSVNEALAIGLLADHLMR